ncbi:MAG TPA: hypothetical protein PK829_15480 [Promineifilum sp.]|nr:hypothetical protein [Promineifilum sp.]
MDAVGAGQVADGIEDVWPAAQVGHQEDLVDALTWPRLGGVFLAGQQQHARAEGLGGG